MKIKIFTHIKLLTSVLLTCLVTSGSAFVTVGATPDCDFHSIVDAYDDADVFVRISTDSVYSDLFTFRKTKWLTGGYDTCAEAEAGILGESKTQWTGFNAGAVIGIDADLATVSIITLDNFDIFEGRDVSPGGAGGILIEGNSTLLLANSDVHDNEGDQGGGIRVVGQNASVIISNTFISSNSAEDFGGGVYCDKGASFTMLGESAINFNTATNKGGGIMADGDCQIEDESGSIASGFSAEFGIFGNQADFGGGVYLQGGADMLLTGDDNHPAGIDLNFSMNVNEQFRGGAGVYITGASSTFAGVNSRIINNFAMTSGAGIVVLDFAHFTMTRLDSKCWDNDACSSLSQNVVNTATGTEGAGYIANNAVVNISQTKIDNNQARRRSVFNIKNASVRLEGNVITNNKAPMSPVTSDNLFALEDNASLDFHYNTLTENNSAAMFELKLKKEQLLKVHNSIIWDQGNIYTTVDNSGQTLPLEQDVTFSCNGVHSIDSLADIDFSDTFAINPEFVDAANGNYHVIPSSFALDMCDESIIQSSFKDLNGNNRGYDDPNVLNFKGPYDAGAYELTEEPIFKNGFE